jgi:uncharacterized membrane protein
MTPNLSRDERLLTMVAGVGAMGLAVYFPRFRKPLAVTSASLIARATAGYCPVTAALSRPQLRSGDTRVELGGPRGSHLAQVVVINASADEVYRFWRDPVKLSQALPSTVHVSARDNHLWDWSLGTAGTPNLATWTSEIIHDEPGKLLSWKTTDDSTIVSAGSVTMRELPGRRGTEVRVRMQYSPPLGKLGAAVARVAGHGADAFVREYLRDIKHFIELDQTSPVNVGV